MTTAGSQDCLHSLSRFAEGELQLFTGLPPGCERSLAEQALGPSEEETDGVGWLAGQLTTFRRYPPRGFAPQGVIVWLHQHEIAALQINQPDLPVTKLEEILGSPEATEPSGLHSFTKQWIYASRGLTVHLRPSTSEVFRLYGYRPMTVEEFLNSPLSQVSIRRVRLKRR
ncbi:MAG: hypothetical protein ACE5ID_11105 [Acidobacteriota bacterium]